MTSKSASRCTRTKRLQARLIVCLKWMLSTCSWSNRKRLIRDSKMRVRDCAKSITRKILQHFSRIQANWSTTNSQGQTHSLKPWSKRTRTCRRKTKTSQSKMLIKKCSSSNSQRDATSRICSSRRGRLMPKLSSNCKLRTKRWIRNFKKIKSEGKSSRGITTKQ